MFRPLATAAVLFAAPLAYAAPEATAGPLDTTRAFYKALHAGDARTAAKYTEGEARPLLTAFVRVARAHRELEAALAKKFGTEEAGRVGYGNRVQQEVKALLGAQEEVAGNEARVTTLDGQPLATLHRIGKAWKVDLDEEAAAPEARLRAERESKATIAASRAVQRGIRSGKYADAAAAVQDFQVRVAKVTGAPPPAPRVEEDGEADPQPVPEKAPVAPSLPGAGEGIPL